MLSEYTLTYSPCVEHTAQRLFLAIAFHLDLHIYGTDASDAFLHTPGPSVPSFVSIYDQFSDWYIHKFGKNIDRDKVLPVLRSLQGHPDPGRLWGSLISQILNIMVSLIILMIKLYTELSTSLMEKLSIF